MSIPPAPKRSRQVTEHIRTSTARGRVYATYSDAWRNLKLVREGADECAALNSLTGSMLNAVGKCDFCSEAEWHAAREVLHALIVPEPGTPWEQLPLGERGPKPRAKRHDWTDAVTGKRVMIHRDTMRAHRDPNCTCPHCPPLKAPTT